MSTEPEAKLDRLLGSLEQLFVEGKNSDVILKVGDHEFPAHKGILSVRSPVFACMFNHDTAEKMSGVVVIEDCTPESFEILLRYLYTGSVNAICTENVFSLYYVADKYCIDDLKDYIISFLKNHLSEENCCDVFTLSLRHNDLELQKLTVNYVSEHMLKVVKTTTWRNFLHECPVEVNALLSKVMETLKYKKVKNECNNVK